MSKPINVRWLGLAFISLILVAAMNLYWGFNFPIGVSALILIQGLMVILCEKQEKSTFPFFQCVTIILLTLSLGLISQTAYIEKVDYWHWLFYLSKDKPRLIGFEMATYIGMHYFLVTMLLYRRPLLKRIRSQIDNWLPPEWILIIAILLMIQTRVGFSQLIKITSLVIGAAILIMILLMRSAEQKVYGTHYLFEAKAYLLNFVCIVLVLWVVGNNMPMIQELPGTRWLKNLAINLNSKGALKDHLPVKSQLTKDLVLSDAVLFEVDTTEPLYLRELAYRIYKDNTWQLEMEEGSYENYIDFKPAYLEAEYSQTTTILNEIAWLRGQDPELFTEYANLLSRESSTRMKKQYVINQNPINKINYFTVNGFYEIKDSLANRIYYYGSLENIYLHSNRLIEPTYYQVNYYDRTPRMGSREYVFLKGLSHERFMLLDVEMKECRRQGLYNPEVIPKLLKTYTLMIQYQKVRDGYLQMPEDIKEDIYKLTKEVTKEKISDWDQAEAIRSYLKTNYTYNLRAKPNEQGDDVYNFLFNNKQGVCQDFASSMVLMCRSIDIPARYVTGYLVTQKKAGTTHTYIVREKDAHAFVEVYIPAYGWMLFDPTPSAQREDLENMQTQSETQTNYKQLGLGITVLAIGLFLVIKCLEQIKILYWLVLLRIKPTKWAIDSLMKKTLLYLEQIGFPKEEKETIHQYKKRMATKEIDIEVIVALFEKNTFGREAPSKEALKLAVKNYKKLTKNETQLKKSARNSLDRIH